MVIWGTLSGARPRLKAAFGCLVGRARPVGGHCEARRCDAGAAGDFPCERRAEWVTPGDPFGRPSPSNPLFDSTTARDAQSWVKFE